jgi:hypothetical protein
VTRKAFTFDTSRFFCFPEGVNVMKKVILQNLFFSRVWVVSTILGFILFPILGSIDQTIAQESKSPDQRDKRVEELERAVKDLMEEVETLKKKQQQEKDLIKDQEESISQIGDQMEEMSQSTLLSEDSWVNKFQLGGYGEMHANFTVGDDDDKFDIHRLVLSLGYDFNEWIKFNSELELEHAFVSSDSGGELVLEQAYLDFLLSTSVNVRVGRVLTPLGIINQKHEPPTFNGVERPAFATFIIPTTWSSDGIGIFGSLTPSLQYEAYVVGGLDGAEFNDIDGIRDGRIKETPSLNDPAFTARLDFYPFAQHSVGYGQTLRLGISTYIGGLDNGNNGDNPGIDGYIQIYSGDFEYSILDLDFRGAIAYEYINGAREIGNGTASEIFGWYVETGYHFWPDSFKKGLLEKSDAVLFARYDDYNTQYKMPSGVSKNPAGDRYEWTFGLNFYFLPNLVFKADYQIPQDKSDNDPDDLFNLGIGWQF